MTQSSETTLLDFAPISDTFRQDVLEGLGQYPRTLPCKYFYDEHGSQLFDDICELDEYYLTRTELAIMERFAPEMAAQIGPGAMLIEYGSGSSIKTRLLLDALPDPVAYVPVDISREHLQHTASRLSAAYEHIEILPVCADFTKHFDLPTASRPPTHSAVYFPGSTIGNFTPELAQSMLAAIVPLCGRGGGLLIGIDLQKDVDVLEAAYNDASGTTAEFNLNLLTRINRELDGNFDLDAFRHVAFYNAEHSRIEIYLESQRNQMATVGEESFVFEAAERIHTENSHKYSIEGFAKLAADVGLTLRRHWTDDQQLFAVLHFAVVSQ